MELFDKQIGKIVEQLKIALLSHVPVAYIPTNDMDLLREILYSEETHSAIIPRIIVHQDNSKECLKFNEFHTTARSGVAYIKDNYYIFDSKNALSSIDFQVPVLIVFNLVDWDNIPSTLTEFIHTYISYKKGDKYYKDSNIATARRSLCIVSTPTNLPVPPQLIPYVKKISIPSLSDEEIREIVAGKISSAGYPADTLSEDFMNEIIVSLRGFPSSKIQNLFDEIIAQEYIQPKGLDKGGISSTIRNEKKAMMEDSPGLKWENVGNVEAAGLSKITEWLEQRKEIFKDPAKAIHKHIDVPKGILISGVPGSGKSLMAKTAASILGLPLISLDMGAMLGSLMGQSEHNMIEALHMAEQMAPCVLWIDEIEKAFSGSSQGASSGDSGVGRRMFGKFLTWMQEKASACFVFATSNDISNLPPELFRSERFDCKYFTFMPTAEECAEIFASIIRKANLDYRGKNISKDDILSEKRPSKLFHEESERKEFWLKILNNCCANMGANMTLQPLSDSAVENDNIDEAYYWEKNIKPTFKLLTGADISALVKILRFKLSQIDVGDCTGKDCIYDANTIAYHASHIFESENFKPYGETNVRDIVKCFNKLYINQFVSASGACILNFDNYYDDEKKYIPNNDNKTFTHRYDTALHYMLVGAINKYSKKLSYEVR